MKKLIFIHIFIISFLGAQKTSFQTLLKDKISIRAIVVDGNRVYYAGSYSKLGYVSLKDSSDKKQILLGTEKLEFRTLAQNKNYLFTLNVESPAHLFTINKKTLLVGEKIQDTAKTVFFDSFLMDKKNRGFAISDPYESGTPHFGFFCDPKLILNQKQELPTYAKGEAHFAASNTNISMLKDQVWIATGGAKARIFKFNWKKPMEWQAFETPFIHGTSSQGIYSIDFLDENFGIAVGGDYTKQAENINNIATTNNGGETWTIRASGKNGGYKTCVKIRPKSKGKDIIAVGDQNIELSTDYGKTWKIISEEKGLFVCEWINENTIVLAGKNRIIRLNID